MGILPIHIKRKEYDKIGYIFIVFGTIITVPQAIQIYETESAKDVNIITYSGWLISDIFWIIYGYERKTHPIIAGSSVKLIINGFIISGIIQYGGYL